MRCVKPAHYCTQQEEKNVKEKYDHNLNRRIIFQDRLGHKVMKYLNSKQTKCLLCRH